MKKLLTATGLPLLVVMAASLGAVQSSHAQELGSRFSRQTPQSIMDSESRSIASEAKDTSITSSAKANLPANYGIIRSVSNGTLDVRMLDGTSKQLPISETLVASTSGLKRGDLIGFDTDPSGNLTKVQPPEVDRTIEGTVSAIDGNQVTVKSATGESITTPIETATINRMSLAPGSQLKVTTYKNTWASKICGAVTPPPPPISNVPVDPPTPIPTGGATPPPQPKGVLGLW